MVCGTANIGTRISGLFEYCRVRPEKLAGIGGHAHALVGDARGMKGQRMMLKDLGCLRHQHLSFYDLA